MMTDPRGPNWRRAFDGHDCNYPGCKEVVSGHLWGCKAHWFQVPVELRDRFLAANRKRDRDRATKSISIHLEITNGI